MMTEMEGVRHKAGELKFSKLLNQNHKLPTSLSYSGLWLALTSPSPLSVLACTLLFLPSSAPRSRTFLLVRMLCWIEYIYRKFQKQSALQEHWQRCVQLWRKGNKG